MLKFKRLPVRQVGNGEQDHATWTSPERMDPKRPAYKIDASKPGSDAAGETAAAMACGYLAFKTKGWQNIPLLSSLSTLTLSIILRVALSTLSIILMCALLKIAFHVKHHSNVSFINDSFGR